MRIASASLREKEGANTNQINREKSKTLTEKALEEQSNTHNIASGRQTTNGTDRA
jgi:hypothetical protein